MPEYYYRRDQTPDRWGRGSIHSSCASLRMMREGCYFVLGHCRCEHDSAVRTLARSWPTCSCLQRMTGCAIQRGLQEDVHMPTLLTRHAPEVWLKFVQNSALWCLFCVRTSGTLYVVCLPSASKSPNARWRYLAAVKGILISLVSDVRLSALLSPLVLGSAPRQQPSVARS